MSHEAQEAAAEYAAKYMDLATDPSEWSETARAEEPGPYGEEYDHATLQHTSGAVLHALTHVDDGDSWSIIEGGTLLYDISQDSNMASLGAEFAACFCPKDFWERNTYLLADVLHDHQAAGLMIVHDMPRALADEEVQEGDFALPSSVTSMADAHAYLQKLGYEYRDMTTDRSVPSATAPGATGPVRRSGGEVAAAEIFAPIIKLFEDNDPSIVGCDIYLGQLLADQMDLYDYPEGSLNSVVDQVLDRIGIPNAMTNVFAQSDRGEILNRLKKAASTGAANAPSSKADPAITQAIAASKLPPLDLDGMNAGEIYRLAIRGKVPQFAAIGWTWCDGKGQATEDELAWYCGYIGHDGRLIRDLHIPDRVFSGWFPEYNKTTWNDYEPKDESNYHTMPMPDEAYVEGVRAIIASRYADRGVAQIADMTDEPMVPLVPTSTAAATRANPVYDSSSGESEIVTLKAYPPGHTGMAPAVTSPAVAPVLAPTAPIPESAAAPQSVADDADSEQLWREYQLDINALVEHGIQRAGYQVVNTTPNVVFALGFLDENGGIVDVIPQSELTKLFSEYTISCLDDGMTYRVDKLFGQALSDLEKVVRERLDSVKIFDSAS